MAPRSAEWTRLLRSALADGRVAWVLIAAFAVFNLIGLDRVPLVDGDEPWIAEPGFEFWQHGAFVSELHHGFVGAERHYLLHFPLFSIIVGGVVSLFGRGLVQVRLVSLSMAVATAALTFVLGRRLLSARHGLLAVLALTMWRIAPGLPFQPSGIALVDLGRLARYDIAVPVFGVTAFLITLRLLGVGSRAAFPRDARSLDIPRLVLAGACAGLAVLSHPAGLAWVAVLCATLWVARAPAAALHASAWIVAGTVIVMLPYLWFVRDGWSDLLAQQRFVSERYDLLNGWFYVRNVANEWRRYSQIGHGLEHALPGAWLIVLCGVAGVWALWRDDAGHDLPRRVLKTALLVALGLFAVGLRPKQYFYVATLWPLIALTVAVGLERLLRAPTRGIRLATAALLALAIVDGLFAWARIPLRAASATPYRVVCDRLATHLPADARLLAAPQYWLGLASRVKDYRSLLVPVWLASRPENGTFAETLSAAGGRADVILIDPSLLAVLDKQADPHASTPASAITVDVLKSYLAEHSVRHVGLDDPSYGHFEIHYLR